MHSLLDDNTEFINSKPTSQHNETEAIEANKQFGSWWVPAASTIYDDTPMQLYQRSCKIAARNSRAAGPWHPWQFVSQPVVGPSLLKSRAKTPIVLPVCTRKNRKMQTQRGQIIEYILGVLVLRYNVSSLSPSSRHHHFAMYEALIIYLSLYSIKHDFSVDDTHK